ncbi:hypothetical protein C5167_032867 [Papaver somniferum]|uniref:Uncharacterized protein n=1 Tax=Papaver somniferum TaxID=3469 RepID=A0A4Y7KCJ3_PAPSO|nr:hypothetical protein C5167_032867 [Papaver somniferum]
MNILIIYGAARMENHGTHVYPVVTAIVRSKYLCGICHEVKTVASIVANSISHWTICYGTSGVASYLLPRIFEQLPRLSSVTKSQYFCSVVISYAHRISLQSYT